MTKKQLRMMTFMLPMLVFGAVAVNYDALFGDSKKGKSAGAAQAANQAPEPSDQPTPQAPTSIASEPMGMPLSQGGNTISAEQVKLAANASAKLRDPFQTLGEQDPEYARQHERREIWPPPEKYAQITMVKNEKNKLANIDGQILREGDSYFGGTVISIKRDGVIVEMSLGRQWLIPLAPSASREGLSHERATKENKTE